MAKVSEGPSLTPPRQPWGYRKPPVPRKGRPSWPNRHTIWVSPEAYEGLKRIGTTFCKSTKLADILEALPSDPQFYVDHRPADLKRADLPRLEVDLFPMWTNDLPRHKYTVVMTQAVMNKLNAIADHFVITNHRRPKTSFMEVTSRISITLEAIGIDYLQVRPPFAG